MNSPQMDINRSADALLADKQVRRDAGKVIEGLGRTSPTRCQCAPIDQTAVPRCLGCRHSSQRSQNASAAR